MDNQLIASVGAQLGIAAVFLAMLKIVYDDWKAERVQAAAERQVMIDKLDDVASIKQRLTHIEDHLGIYDPPTLPKPPTT